MAYQVNLSWPAARKLAMEGAMVRRIGWLDRWLFFQGGLWWILPFVGLPHVVRSDEFTRSEFLASDFTTTLPSQYLCFTPVEPEIPDPEPPEQPEAGGPVNQLYQFYTETAQPGGRYYPNSPLYGQRSVSNPMAAAANVWLHGRADDRFRVKLPGASSFILASVASTSDPDYTATVDFRFALPAGASFEIAGSNEYGGPCKFDVTGTFTI